MVNDVPSTSSAVTEAAALISEWGQVNAGRILHFVPDAQRAAKTALHCAYATASYYAVKRAVEALELFHGESF